MPESNTPLKLTQTIHAPVEQVYRAFTNRTALAGWLGDVVEADARENGRFYIWWNEGYFTSGVYQSLEKNKTTTISWNGSDDPARTQVEVSLSSQEGNTTLVLEHTGIGTGEGWREGVVATYQKEWQAALNNLKSVLERGIDMRLYDRPMLGIFPGILVGPEEAKKEGLPEPYGVRLDGVVNGMGAETAGLQEEDIILQIGEVETKGYADFGLAMKPFKAGDQVEVIYVRGTQKNSLELTLSGRPLPEPPPTARELTEALRETYQKLNDQLEKLFEGVPLEEASQRPEPKEWSARETVAHLIFHERWIHMHITNVISGQRSGGYSNDLATHAGLSKSYPTNEQLIQEFKRSGEVTLAAVEGLPAKVVQLKGEYTKLAEYLLKEGPTHSHVHFGQIKEALEAARTEG